MKQKDRTAVAIRALRSDRGLRVACLDAIDAADGKDVEGQVYSILQWFVSSEIIAPHDIYAVSVPLVRDYLLGLHK